ncbi:hypothetical protein [Sphingobacterium paludis]|uniref:Outer membrane protein with beta-barrel domain n=1 Tax=Sphingobacterium paludis TaxID=1476465 RepID=A0A4R7D7I0_9SPHI|nr:hypothetical protein [Sphingobacterium paludis]TDS14956.1 hypothetical protein B0I21_103458 [Sphingobacterium paludis]
MATFNLTADYRILVACILLLLFQLPARAQTISSKDYYFKIGVAAHSALGNVNIKKSGERFYGNVFLDGTDAGRVQTNHESVYWRPLSLSFGKNVFDRYSLGVGMEIDVYAIGDRNRSSAPIFADATYSFGLSNTGTFFLNLKPGYSISVEDVIHSGLKIETAIGYEFKTGRRRNMSYGFSLGYNYQELKKVVQTEMQHIEGTINSYTQVSERLVDISLSFVPLTFFIRL